MRRALTCSMMAVALVGAGGCAGRTGPVALDTSGAETCASCRMSITSTRTAAQIVAPGEEPRFFDDIGCLGDYRRAHAVPSGAATYVADHHTGAWVVASHAVYGRADEVSTPMGSHLMAWESDTSRRADAAAHDAVQLAAFDAIGSQGDIR